MKLICLYPLRVYDFITFFASSFDLYWWSTSFYTLSRSYFWRSVNLASTYFLPVFVDKTGDLSQRTPMVKNPYCWLFLYFPLISGMSRDSMSMKSRPFALAAISSSSATRVSTLRRIPLLTSLVSCALFSTFYIFLLSLVALICLSFSSRWLFIYWTSSYLWSFLYSASMPSQSMSSISRLSSSPWDSSRASTKSSGPISSKFCSESSSNWSRPSSISADYEFIFSVMTS